MFWYYQLDVAYVVGIHGIVIRVCGMSGNRRRIQAKRVKVIAIFEEVVRNCPDWRGNGNLLKSITITESTSAYCFYAFGQNDGFQRIVPTECLIPNALQVLIKPWVL